MKDYDEIQIAYVFVHFIFVIFGFATAPKADYYLYNGFGSLVYMRGDPANSMRNPKWAVFYYEKGQPTDNPNKKWGMDVVNDANILPTRVKQNQEFEDRWERWVGPWGPHSFKNPLYPILYLDIPESFAELKDHRIKNILTEVHDAFNTISRLVGTFNTAAKLADQPEIPLPRGPIWDFLAAMRRSLEQGLTLRNELGTSSAPAMENIIRNLGMLNGQLELASQSLDRAEQALRSGGNSATQSSRNGRGLVLPAPWGPGILDQTANVQGGVLIIDRGGGALARHYAIPLSDAKVNIPDDEPFNGAGGGNTWQLVFQCRNSDDPCIQGAGRMPGTSGTQAEILFPSKEAGIRFLQSWKRNVR